MRTYTFSKQPILCIGVLLFVCTQAFTSATAQVGTKKYHPLAVEGKVWNFKRPAWGPLVVPNEAAYHQYSYMVKGDTIINGFTYKKLYMNDFTYPISGWETAEEFYADPWWGNYGFLDNDWHYICALRDDDSRAYIIRDKSYKEYLIYDMSLEPGIYEDLHMKVVYKYSYSEHGVDLDVIRWHYWGDGPVPTGAYLTYWIEGVGRISDFFHPQSRFRQEITSAVSPIESVFENGVCIYGDPSVNTAIRAIPQSPSNPDAHSSFVNRHSSSLYDLQGRRLSAPPARGMYIQDKRVKILCH